MARRRRLEDRLRRVLRSFNFGEVQTPTFEELALFEAKAGEGIREEIYAFQDKGGRDLCLRPELTLPVMRFYFGSELKTQPKPLRLYYFGPCYRYDRPQAGRYREFWQLGAEVVGDASPAAHAELLWLALTLFREAGVTNLRLRVGHLGILRSILSRFGVPREQVPALMRLIDKKDLEGIRAALAGAMDAAALENFLALFPLADRVWRDEEIYGASSVIGDPSFWRGLLDHNGVASADHLVRVVQHLGAFGADAATIGIDPMIARGLEYYNGLVFELDCPDLGAEKQLLGGGEYDLSGVFDAQPIATVGFGLGFDRTLVALERQGRVTEAADRVDALVAALSEPAVAAAQRVASNLRELDLRVELEASGRGPKRALQRATAVAARVAILVGERELERGVASLKNLDTGDQVEVALGELPSRVAAAVR
jgi:histidyl-tRNA synthetase